MAPVPASPGAPPIRRDPSDLRDQVYLPSLRPLAPRTDLPPCLAGGTLLPRDQQEAESCAGQALAALIDLQHQSAGAATGRVSARMLYRMALVQDGSSGGGVASLRSVLKGFYHYGVCPESLWPDESGSDALTAERAKAARGVTLGAYYRVLPGLNDWHAALTDVGALLVSAEIHEGWDCPFDPQKPRDRQGLIAPRRSGGTGHAFLVVGYTETGFLVLNSWGAAWGGYDGRPGIALWPYEDWAETVMDAWVLRLGVPAPAAFAQARGLHGLGFDTGPLGASQAACHRLLGHFAHLDDGRHVDSGSYASSRASVEETARCLEARPRPVLLSVAGSLFGLQAGIAHEIRRRPTVEAAGLYPYTVFWCNDAFDSTSLVLDHLFEKAVQKVGPFDPTLDDTIERDTAPIGRAFWRDVKAAAWRAGSHRRDGSEGDAAHLFDRLAATGVPLHLLTDGAGAILLGRYLRSLEEGALPPDEAARRQRLRERFFAATASLTLVTPPLTLADFDEAFGPLIDHLPEGRATLWVPSRGLDAKLHVGAYARSILHLICHGFERGEEDGTDAPTRSFVGMPQHVTALPGRLTPRLAKLAVCRIAQPDASRPRFTQADVSLSADCHRRTLDRIRAIEAQRQGGTDDGENHARAAAGDGGRSRNAS
ncbi:Cysteine protease [Rhodobacter sp. AKP1]|nr:Cysteine protease [Rhodobacter sp. AKP1]